MVINAWSFPEAYRNAQGENLGDLNDALGNLLSPRRRPSNVSFDLKERCFSYSSLLAFAATNSMIIRINCWLDMFDGEKFVTMVIVKRNPNLHVVVIVAYTMELAFSPFNIRT